MARKFDIKSELVFDFDDHIEDDGPAADPKKLSKEWRTVPGYDGLYEISFMGEVRTYRYRGELRRTEPVLLKQFIKRQKKGNGYSNGFVAVKLTNTDGKIKFWSVMRLMVDVWLGGVPKGLVPYHKNGNMNDNRLTNIGIDTAREVGRISGRKNRKPVIKENKAGEVVAIYRSCREAARKNYMSQAAMAYRAAGKVRDPFSLDGFRYRYEE